MSINVPLKSLPYLFSLLVAVLSSEIGTSQVNTDSLWQVWNDEIAPDTSRADALREYIWQTHLFSNSDSAFFFAQLEYDFAQSRDLKNKMGDALNIQGISLAMKGDYVKALGYFQKSLGLFEEANDNMGIAHASNSIGNTYRELGNTANALRYYKKSFEYSELAGDTHSIGRALVNIGTIYSSQEEFELAFQYYNQGLLRSREVFDKRSMATILGRMGQDEQNQQRYASALDYYNQSLSLYTELSDQLSISIVRGNMAVVYGEQGFLDDAQRQLDESMAKMEKIGFRQGLAEAAVAKGDFYLKQGLLVEAVEWCKKGLIMNEESQMLPKQLDACKCLYDAYKSLGNSNKALEYHERMLTLTDSLNKDETAKQLQQMEFAKQIHADSLAQEEEILRVEMDHQLEVSEKEKSRNIAFGIGFFLLLLAGGFYSRWRYVRKSKASLQTEKDRSDNLLLNILPAEIAEELKITGKAQAQDFDMVSILFTDFKGFTEASEKLSAQDLVAEINTCFEAFDGIMAAYGIEKIKTIGDAYMAAGGLPVPTDESVKNTVLAALEMQAFIAKRKIENDKAGTPAFEMRVGIHTGPVVAGIVGVKKFQYDIWGDTVNTASRMESGGEVGQVNISETTYELMKGCAEFSFTSRGKIEAKGKGEMEMYFVSRVDDVA